MSFAISININYRAEEREDEWAFFVEKFGFWMYAANEEDGAQKVKEGIGLILKALENDQSKIENYLNARQVEYQISPANTEPRSIRYEEVLFAPAV